MACAIPTTPVDTGMTYGDFTDHYQDAIGVASAPLIASIVGQRVACAAEQAYWEIYNCLTAWGVSDDCIEELFIQATVRGPLSTWYRWLAAYYWLSDSAVARDDPTFQRALRYREDWEELCASGGVLTKPDGTKVDLSATGGTAAARQALKSYRENSAGQCNDWRFQSTPQQFLGGFASSKAASFRYGNGRYGGNPS